MQSYHVNQFVLLHHILVLEAILVSERGREPAFFIKEEEVYLQEEEKEEDQRARPRACILY
jgi:hypothetical protein